MPEGPIKDSSWCTMVPDVSFVANKCSHMAIIEHLKKYICGDDSKATPRASPVTHVVNSINTPYEIQ